MKSQVKGYFTILERMGESGFKIQENVPESVQESIEVAISGPVKTNDGKPAIIFKTTLGRQFARLEEWPEDLLLEIPQS